MATGLTDSSGCNQSKYKLMLRNYCRRELDSADEDMLEKHESDIKKLWSYIDRKYEIILNETVMDEEIEYLCDERSSLSYKN